LSKKPVDNTGYSFLVKRIIQLEEWHFKDLLPLNKTWKLKT
jgi:hypothetical protein